MIGISPPGFIPCSKSTFGLTHNMVRSHGLLRSGIEHFACLPLRWLAPSFHPTGELLEIYTDANSDLLNVTEAQILNKSKANGFGKLFVRQQTSWFRIQFLARFLQNLPASLFKPNTFAYSQRALLAYLMWRNILLDVREPTISEGTEEREPVNINFRTHTPGWILTAIYRDESLPILSFYSGLHSISIILPN